MSSKDSEARLHEIRRTLPANSVPLPKGCGYRAWETRRANAFRRALSDLKSGLGAIEQLTRAAATASEYIAAMVPVEVTALPRGYSLVANGGGERTLARDGILISPWYSDPLPTRAALLRLGADFKTGLMPEIEAYIRAGKK